MSDEEQLKGLSGPGSERPRKASATPLHQGTSGIAKFLPTSRNRGWFLGLLLVAAVIFAYQPAWHAGFIWDDNAHVTKPALRSLNGLARIWMQLGATQQYYPLVHSVFWVEHRLWGDATVGYHLINILLHAVSALLLVKLLRQLKIPGAWLAAAIFALHPVQVESVAWISELKNTLSGAFYLGSALAYLGFDRNRSGGNYALALGLFVLGLLSKTVIATLPAALLVVFWWQRGKLCWKQDVRPLLPFFIAGIGAGLFTAWVEGKYIIGAESSEFNFSIIERFLIAGRVTLVLPGQTFLAGKSGLCLSPVACQPDGVVAIFVSGGGLAVVGGVGLAAAAVARAFGGAALLWRDAVSGLGFFQCVSVPLFARG
jgi:hypothetical protein